MSAPKCPPLDRVIAPELGDEWPADGVGSVALVMDALPDPGDLPPGAFVGVLAAAPARSSLRSLFRRRPSAHVAVRCAALLARGYCAVGAGVDEQGREIAWGRVPS